jgi:hypothetical protein
MEEVGEGGRASTSFLKRTCLSGESGVWHYWSSSARFRRRIH